MVRLGRWSSRPPGPTFPPFRPQRTPILGLGDLCMPTIVNTVAPLHFPLRVGGAACVRLSCSFPVTRAKTAARSLSLFYGVFFSFPLRPPFPSRLRPPNDGECSSFRGAGGVGFSSSAFSPPPFAIFKLPYLPFFTRTMLMS